MKPSEVIVECSDHTSNFTDLKTDKFSDSCNTAESKGKCIVPPTDELSGESKPDKVCNDLCNELGSLGIRDVGNDLNHDNKLQNKESGENELEIQLQRLSLGRNISKNLDENKTEFVSKDTVNDEEQSSLEYEMSEKSENTDYVIRGLPQEHEDVDTSNKRILLSRGPAGGVPANQPTNGHAEVNWSFSQNAYEWPNQIFDYDYERQMQEPSSKFRKPTSDAYVNQTPFCWGKDSELPQHNWLSPCDTRPGMQLFTSHMNLSGGSVAVQPGQSPQAVSGLPVVSLAPNVVHQQVVNQEDIDEFFQPRETPLISAELVVASDVWEEALAPEFLEEIITSCEKTLYGEESLTPGGGYDIAESVSGGGYGIVESVSGGGYGIVESVSGGGCGIVESVSGGGCDIAESVSDGGYYSPGYNISSPGSSAEISTLCPSPDNLSNDSGDLYDDDLALVLGICQEDLKKRQMSSTVTSPPHVIESYKVHLMAECNDGGCQVQSAEYQYDASSFVPIPYQNPHGTEQSIAKGRLVNAVMGPNQRILPKCSPLPQGYSTSQSQQHCSPVLDLPSPVVQRPLKSSTVDTAVAAERKYVEIRPKPQPLEQMPPEHIHNRFNCTPGE